MKMLTAEKLVKIPHIHYDVLMTNIRKNKKTDDLEATHDSMIPIEETTHLNVIHEHTTNSEPLIEESPRKKRKVTILRAQLVLLVLAAALLVTSIYAFRHADDIQEALRSDAVATAVSNSDSSSTTTYTALPEELTSPSSLTVLVDRTHNLPADYVPANLTSPYLISTTSVIELREEAANACKEMMTAVAEAGLPIYITKGYISYEEQGLLYQDRVDLVGEETANKQIEKAGFSEHQTGLAVDFTDEATTITNSVSFGETETCQWLFEHAHEYGFILRYPEGKEDITGYGYLPSHYRYVGTEIATAMYNIASDLTFEEYFEITK